MDLDRITENVIGAALEVHRTLGAGLLESTYEQCLIREFQLRELKFENQKAMPVIYKGLALEYGYRIDFLVQDRLIVEIKSVNEITQIHLAQILSYMRLSECTIGLLINFNVKLLKDGLRRVKL